LFFRPWLFRDRAYLSEELPHFENFHNTQHRYAMLGGCDAQTLMPPTEVIRIPHQPHHFLGVHQILDDYHLSEHLYTFAQLHYLNNPAGAKAGVDQKMGALLRDRVRAVLSPLKRMRPWEQALRTALATI
jgi:hypothetical protein